MSWLFTRAATLFVALLLTAATQAGDKDSFAPCRFITPELQSRTYAVADLIVPIADFSVPESGTKQASPNPEKLIELLKHTVAPESWTGDGAGTVEYFPLGMALVVKQSVAVHERIADFLASQRKKFETQVVLEMRIISLSDDTFERIGCDFNAAPDGKDVQFLGDEQMKSFLAAAQGQQRTNILQAPKMTLFDGQKAAINLTENHAFLTAVELDRSTGKPILVPKNEVITTGLKMNARPQVSADRKFVNLAIDFNWTQLASEKVPLMPVCCPIEGSDNRTVPFTQFVQQPKVKTVAFERNVTVPDGGTVLLGSFKQECETRHESCPPVVSKVPYVGRLFKNVGYGRESKTVLVLVTSRIVVEPQEEAKITVPCPPVKVVALPRPTPAAHEEKHVALDFQIVDLAGHEFKCVDSYLKTLANKAKGLDEAATAELASLLERIAPTGVVGKPNVVTKNGTCATVKTGNYTLKTTPVLSPDGNTIRCDVNLECATPTGGVKSLNRRALLANGRTLVLGPLPHVAAATCCSDQGQKSLLVLVKARTLAVSKPVVVTKEVSLPSSEACEDRLVASKSSGRSARVLAVLLKEYEAACKEGRDDEAGKLARAALAIDPKCFSTK